jgi:hypothetical protein
MSKRSQKSNNGAKVTQRVLGVAKHDQPAIAIICTVIGRRSFGRRSFNRRSALKAAQTILGSSDRRSGFAGALIC